jgi:carboxylate-amine ligase
MADAFGSQTPFSVGVEEELFLVDPVTGRQANASEAVQQRLGPVQGTVERELHACHVELITDICANAGQAVGMLGGLRRAVVATGAGLLGSGTHPSAAEGEAEITDKERYERIRELLGDAVATPVGGCTSTSACPTPRRRSARSTACAGTCRCSRRWQPTRLTATAATPGWPPPAR